MGGRPRRQFVAGLGCVPDSDAEYLGSALSLTLSVGDHTGKRIAASSDTSRPRVLVSQTLVLHACFLRTHMLAGCVVCCELH